MGTTQSPLKKIRQPARRQFSAHVYCGQTAVCIRVPLVTEVGLSLGDIVLDGDPDPLPLNGHVPPSIFGQCPLWPNGWMDQDATWYGGKPRPRRRCVRWGRSPPPKKKRKGHSPPVFGLCLLWPQSPISATAELFCANGCPKHRQL